MISYKFENCTLCRALPDMTTCPGLRNHLASKNIFHILGPHIAYALFASVVGTALSLISPPSPQHQDNIFSHMLKALPFCTTVSRRRPVLRIYCPLHSPSFACKQENRLPGVREVVAFCSPKSWEGGDGNAASPPRDYAAHVTIYIPLSLLLSRLQHTTQPHHTTHLAWL